MSNTRNSPRRSSFDVKLQPTLEKKESDLISEQLALMIHQNAGTAAHNFLKKKKHADEERAKRLMNLVTGDTDDTLETNVMKKLFKVFYDRLDTLSKEESFDLMNTSQNLKPPKNNTLLTSITSDPRFKALLNQISKYNRKEKWHAISMLTSTDVSDDMDAGAVQKALRDHFGMVG